MKRALISFGLLFFPAMPLVYADDTIGDLQRAQQRQIQIDLQAEQTRIMQEQLDLQRRQVEQQQRAQDDETLRRHNEALRRQKAQQSEIDAELDRQAAEYLREKQRAETAARVKAAAQREQARDQRASQTPPSPDVAETADAFSEGQRLSVAQAQKLYSFANETDHLFGEFEGFLESAATSPENRDIMRDSPSWPMILATEFAARKGIARNAIPDATAPKTAKDEDRIFTAFNLDTGHRAPAAQIHNGRVFRPGEPMGAVAEGYYRTIEPLAGGGMRVTDQRKAD